jgi:hypothetical protein
MIKSCSSMRTGTVQPHSRIDAEAERTKEHRDLRCAYRQLKQALNNDRLGEEG